MGADTVPTPRAHVRSELGDAARAAGTGSPTLVGVVTLARPEKRNALTPEMLGSMPGAIDGLVSRGARSIVLAGEGRVFCAGFDLSLCRDETERRSVDASAPGRDGPSPDTRCSPTPPVLATLLERLSTVARVMRACPVPVIVAAHGGAVAGACALLCAADIAVSDVDARIGYPVVPLGISPAVSAPHLRAQAGDGPARARLLDPGLISGVEANRLGLVHHLEPAREGVLPRAMMLAAELGSKPPDAMRVTKALLNELDGSVDADSLQRATRTSLSLVGGAEQRRLLVKIWSA